MKIKYAHKMIHSMKEVKSLSFIEVNGQDLPDHITEIINSHKDFAVSKTFGAQGMGDPQEYEKIIIEDSTGIREFEYFNKGIYFMMKGQDQERPVFQVFAHLLSLTRE